MNPSELVRRAREQRFQLLRLVVIAGFLAIGSGLMRLQVHGHRRYEELARNNHVRLETLRAPRGAIYDRNGILLADSAPSFSVVFRPAPAESLHRARAAQDPEWVRRVAALIEEDPETVTRAVRDANRSGETVALRRNAPFSVHAAVEETRGELPGIDVQMEPLRRYAFGTVASHLLGYAGEINDRELAEREGQGYRPGDLIGRSGIERSYEKELRGVDGAEFVVVNAAGRRVSTLSDRPPDLPDRGQDLVLTVDMRIQLALEEAMAGVERGAGVAIDPRDGGILGLVSRPAFDPNEFSVGISRRRWRELMDGGANPLLDRALQGLYPPGSTFKVVTMLGALRAGIVRPSTRLAPCFGKYQYGGRSFGCWKREGHGSLDFIGALQHSCDVYFYQIGTRLGLERLEEAARLLGLGAKTGIDLPQEKKGLIPGPAWYDRHWGPGQWRKGLLLNLAIGQGELLVTPIQLALLYAEAANSGTPVRPHVVMKVGGRPAPAAIPEPRRTLDTSAETWRAVHEALEQVVNAGTATVARLQGVRVAGKTGTAQNPHGDDHALFACYAPADDPRIVLAFVIENSGHGGSVAAPMAAHVLKTLFPPEAAKEPLAAAAPDTARGPHGN